MGTPPTPILYQHFHFIINIRCTVVELISGGLTLLQQLLLLHLLPLLLLPLRLLLLLRILLLLVLLLPLLLLLFLLLLLQLLLLICDFLLLCRSTPPPGWGLTRCPRVRVNPHLEGSDRVGLFLLNGALQLLINRYG